MKYLRLGFTESTLLFYWYIENILKESICDYTISQRNLINWLYTTSG